MKACIYARTSVDEKSHKRISLDNQIANARQLALVHNLTIEDEHVFTDVDVSGTVPPTCWSLNDEKETRPALSAMIGALESRAVTRVVVHRLDRLGTSSEILIAFRDLLEYLDAGIVVSPECLKQADDLSESFAASILKPRLVVDTEVERERKQQIKARKREEISRLRAKLSRLEAELAE